MRASSLLVEPSHSLVQQAIQDPLLPGWEQQLRYRPETTLQRNHAVNLDGFGVGWYADSRANRERSGEPAVIIDESAADKYITNPKLAVLGNKVHSNVIFAHIRAKTDGMTSPKDSHPFLYNNILFMHNGGIAQKESLADMLSADCLKKLVKGLTDTEIAGAFFANRLIGDVCNRTDFRREELENSMMQTIDAIKGLDEGSCNGSSLNLAATDGKTVIATRYRTCVEDDPPSLYFAIDNAGGIWIASEPLDEGMDRDEGRGPWTLLAKDEMLSFDTTSGVLALRCLSFACHEERIHRRHKELTHSNYTPAAAATGVLALATYVAVKTR